MCYILVILIFFIPESISVEKSIASQFGLQKFQYVYVTKIKPESVSLQLLELTFKDQYLNRSDMWRLTQSLVRITLSDYINLFHDGIFNTSLVLHFFW